MIALLTGSPGVGKTTIATTLVERYPSSVEAVSFGRLVYDAVRSRLHASLSYAEFRESAAKLVIPEDIMTATELIAGNKKHSGGTWIIVDSHAVAQTRYGWQAHPDTPEVLRRFSYDIILHLDVPPEIILTRIRHDTDGRHSSTVRAIEIQAGLQLSISTYYSGIVGCPLEVIDASGDLSDVVDVIEGVLGLASSLT